MVNLKVGDIAIPTEGCREWLTPNKEYEITIVKESGNFYIVNDEGGISFCLQKNCGHLNGQDWTFKTKSN